MHPVAMPYTAHIFHFWILMLEISLIAAVLALVVVLIVLQQGQPARAAQVLEQQHRAMLTDLHDGLNKQGDRLIAAQAAEAERLRAAVGEELRLARDAIAALQARQDMLRSEILAQTLAKLSEQARADQELIQNSFRNATQHLASSIETLSKTVDGRQEQLGDKRSRGAFGEVQLEGLVRNILPPQAYSMQHTLPNGSRADCVLMLPEPTGMVAVDSKFPLENYHRMFDGGETERALAARQFKADIKKHVDDISSKYIIPEVTSDCAVMFVPAEAVFAEIHAHHPEVVDYAMQRRVWVVSPTTLMAVLNTARAVMKDVETRKQVHIIQDELGKLGKDFGRFDERMKTSEEHPC